MDQTTPRSVIVAHRKEQIGEIVTASICLAAWVVVWFIVQGFPDRAAGYPRFVLICLFVFSTIHLLQALWRLTRTPAREVDAGVETSTPGDEGEAGRVSGLKVRETLILMASAIVYILAIPRLGFFVSTFVFLSLTLGAAIGWSVKRVIGLVLVLGAVYLLVVVLFGIRLPTGFLI